MAQYDYEKVLLGYLDGLKAQLLARPLNLGGVASSGGGAGGGTGYIGQLPQTRITYDTSEVATLDTPISGSSLLDNLNHVRYRIEQLESNPASPLIVKQDGVLVASGVTVIDFLGATVTETSPGELTVLTGSGSGGSSHAHKYNVTVSGTTHFDLPEAFNTNTLRVFYNGVRQDDSYFTPDEGNTGFTLTFTAEAGDEIFVDYDITASGVTASGGGHIIQDEGIALTQRTNLNFVGAGVTVTDDEANDATKVTITSSGGGSGGITWDGNPYTVQNVHTSEATTTGPYKKLTAQIVVSQPLKITEVGWDIKLSGHYSLELQTYPNQADPTLPGPGIIKTFASGIACSSSGITMFEVNPPYVLLPGIYYLACWAYYNTTWYFKSNGRYGNNLFYNQSWWRDGTENTSNIAPICLTAERGVYNYD